MPTSTLVDYDTDPSPFPITYLPVTHLLSICIQLLPPRIMLSVGRANAISQRALWGLLLLLVVVVVVVGVVVAAATGAVAVAQRPAAMVLPVAVAVAGQV